MSNHANLEYKRLWLVIGYLLIMTVVYQTLTANPASAGFNISDKFLHTAGYFILMGWFVQIYHGQRHKFYWALFFVVLGISLEFLQDLSGVRFYEVNDMLANASGVLLAWALSTTKFSDGIYVVEKHMVKFLGRSTN